MDDAAKSMILLVTARGKRLASRLLSSLSGYTPQQAVVARQIHDRNGLGIWHRAVAELIDSTKSLAWLRVLLNSFFLKKEEEKRKIGVRRSANGSLSARLTVVSPAKRLTATCCCQLFTQFSTSPGDPQRYERRGVYHIWGIAQVCGGIPYGETNTAPCGWQLVWRRQQQQQQQQQQLDRTCARHRH